MEFSPFSPWLLGLVVLGSAAGGIARFGLSGWLARRFGERFPFGTLAVNLSGAWLIGLLIPALFDTDFLNAGAGTVLLVAGFLGSYTTVSSFSLQTLALLTKRQWRPAVANISLSLFGCPLAAALGYAMSLAAGRVL